MRSALLMLAIVLGARGETNGYELRGRLLPATRASVWLHGSTAPFEDSTLALGCDGVHDAMRCPSEPLRPFEVARAQDVEQRLFDGVFRQKRKL